MLVSSFPQSRLTQQVQACHFLAMPLNDVYWIISFINRVKCRVCLLSFVSTSDACFTSDDENFVTPSQHEVNSKDLRLRSDDCVLWSGARLCSSLLHRKGGCLNSDGELQIILYALLLQMTFKACTDHIANIREETDRACPKSRNSVAFASA